MTPHQPPPSGPPFFPCLLSHTNLLPQLLHSSLVYSLTPTSSLSSSILPLSTLSHQPPPSAPPFFPCLLSHTPTSSLSSSILPLSTLSHTNLLPQLLHSSLVYSLSHQPPPSAPPFFPCLLSHTNLLPQLLRSSLVYSLTPTSSLSSSILPLATLFTPAIYIPFYYKAFSCDLNPRAQSV